MKRIYKVLLNSLGLVLIGLSIYIQLGSKYYKRINREKEIELQQVYIVIDQLVRLDSITNLYIQDSTKLNWFVLYEKSQEFLKGPISRSTPKPHPNKKRLIDELSNKIDQQNNSYKENDYLNRIFLIDFNKQINQILLIESQFQKDLKVAVLNNFNVIRKVQILVVVLFGLGVLTIVIAITKRKKNI
ncbi:hypothetical protein KDU71_22610 [Carboxylicivirga sediminis]|uniref:Uncharacterized protein n=1 Tax=Carboxylicivirga sediminis TaxID=2006564 RepID=A0A941IYY5_9BACT|nr:hypothetical protein [Carboxylicivirga sediminis]MBR8538381.1 hypothetical protein [Carboxylicivirga sediminis]